MPRAKGMIIFNGLGRFRNCKIFRIFLLILLKIRDGSFTIIFQNYKDFRFFRQFYSNKVLWVPGSGGTKYKLEHNNKKTVTVITRERKLKTQLNGLQDLLLTIANDKEIHLFGSGNISRLLEVRNIDRRVKNMGWVDIKEIIKTSNEFCSLPGYGEGIPHSLIDAICSGLPVWVSNSDYRDFGFYRFDDIEIQNYGNWKRLVFPKSAQLLLNCDKIDNEYLMAYINYTAN